MAFNISSYYDGAAEDYTLDFGSSNAASYFYLINPKTGEWAKCTPKDESKRRIYAYTSEYGIDTGDGDYLTLSHYKGLCYGSALPVLERCSGYFGNL